MKRILCFFCDQFMGSGAHENIRRLDADHKIVISHLFNDAHLIKRTLHKSFGSNTVIFFYQFFFKGTAVYTYTNRDITFLCCIHNCLYPLFRTDISRIDTDLVRTVLHSCNGKAIIKMDVRNQRNMDLFFDLG